MEYELIYWVHLYLNPCSPSAAAMNEHHFSRASTLGFIIFRMPSLGKAAPLALLGILLHVTSAQVETLPQDITTVPAYALQKECALSCIVDGGFCPHDVLGEAIGCATWADCKGGGWAKNACYCRPDLQGPAQVFITSCISSNCDVGDVAIDASSAGSMYAQYCKDKGYEPPKGPATVRATVTTGNAGAQIKSTGAALGEPTATPSNSSGTASSNKLSIGTIIGIVAGGLVAFVCIVVGIKMLVKCIREPRPPKPLAYAQQPPPPSYVPPTWPTKTFAGQYIHPAPPESEVTPDDSRSVVSGTAPAFAPMAPTLISGEHGYGFYRR